MAEIVIVGAGRAGLTLALALHQRRRTRLVCRADTRRAEIERLCPSLKVVGAVKAELEVGSTVVFATPDRALRQASQQWARSVATGAQQTWLHLSGVAAPAVLDHGCSDVVVGSCHPLAAIPDPLDLSKGEDWLARATRPLRGALFAVDGGGQGEAVAIAAEVGGRPVALSAGGRSAYHAAASMLANDWVALLALSQELAVSAGLSPEDARWSLLHLARTALDAVAALEPGESLAGGLTGPVGRGDTETVSAHLQVMTPTAAAVHRLLSRRLLTLVQERGMIEPAAVSALEALLSHRSSEIESTQ